MLSDKMVRQMDNKHRALILEKILKVKGVLFDETRSVDEINGEWKKIADYAKKSLKMKDRDYRYFKGPFMYSCKTSLVRKLLNKKKMPLTRAHLLTMDILGKDSLKLLHEDNSEQDTSGSSEGTSSDVFSSDISMASTSTSKENSEPRRRSKRISKAYERASSEDDDEIRDLKKRKLTLEIECAQLKLDNEKEKSMTMANDKELTQTQTFIV